MVSSLSESRFECTCAYVGVCAWVYTLDMNTERIIFGRKNGISDRKKLRTSKAMAYIYTKMFSVYMCIYMYIYIYESNCI